MIYVCVHAENSGRTIGLLLWKVRRVFTAYPREYQLLVADDASTDETAEALERYQSVLPLTVLRNGERRGYAAAIEALMRNALGRSDRPKRDIAIVLPESFAVSPDAIPDLIRRIESGADVVVGEAVGRDEPFATRAVRRAAPWLLRPGVRVPGVRDFTSGCCALRLMTVKQALERGDGTLLESDDICACAELIARAATHARQIATVPIETRRVASGATRPGAFHLAAQLFRAGRRLEIPAPALRADGPPRAASRRQAG